MRDPLWDVARDMEKAALELAKRLKANGWDWQAENMASKSLALRLALVQYNEAAFPRGKLDRLEGCIEACGKFSHWLRVCEEVDPDGVAAARPYAVKAERAVRARKARLEKELPPKTERKAKS